jgi:hypothetical protein
MSPSEAVPIGPLDPTVAQGFVARVLPAVRRQASFWPFLHYCAGNPFPPAGVTRASDILGESATAYGFSHERAAALKSYETNDIDDALLADQSLTAATAAFVDVVPVDFWPRGEALVLKGALWITPHLHPVEVQRSLLTGPDELEVMLKRFVCRLREARHRIPIVTTNVSPVFVNAMLRVCMREPVLWTGRVSELHELDELKVAWMQPLPADVIDVGEATRDDARAREGAGFGYGTYGDDGRRVLVAYGPSPRDGAFYLQTPRQSAAGLEGSRAYVESELGMIVERIERDEPSLESFRVERLYCLPGNHESYRYLTRRILLAWQYPRFALLAQPGPVAAAGGGESCAPPGAIRATDSEPHIASAPDARKEAT